MLEQLPTPWQSVIKTCLGQAIKQSFYECASWRKGHSCIAGPESPVTQKGSVIFCWDHPVCVVLAVGKKKNISVISSARLSSRTLVSHVFMWVSFLWVLLGVLTEHMTSWRCLQRGGNQGFDVPESLEVRVWVCINLRALRTWPSPQPVTPLWQWRMQWRGLLHRSQR